MLSHSWVFLIPAYTILIKSLSILHCIFLFFKERIYLFEKVMLSEGETERSSLPKWPWRPGCASPKPRARSFFHAPTCAQVHQNTWAICCFPRCNSRELSGDRAVESRACTHIGYCLHRQWFYPLHSGSPRIWTSLYLLPLNGWLKNHDCYQYDFGLEKYWIDVHKTWCVFHFVLPTALLEIRVLNRALGFSWCCSIFTLEIHC